MNMVGHLIIFNHSSSSHSGSTPAPLSALPTDVWVGWMHTHPFTHSYDAIFRFTYVPQHVPITPIDLAPLSLTNGRIDTSQSTLRWSVQRLSSSMKTSTLR